MANPGEVDQATANQVIQESLGLSMEDLGGNPPEDGLGSDDSNLDGGRDNSGDNDPRARGNNSGQDDSSNDDGLFEAPAERRAPEIAPPPERQPRPVAAGAEVRVDQRGNLVSKATGEIVARAGKEARLYQGMHKARQERDSQTAIAQDLTQRLNKAVELGGQLFERLQAQQASGGEFAPEKHGLSREELTEAIGFARGAKTDPVGTIKKLLTRAAAGGIDLSSIGLAGGNFDPKSLVELVQQTITQQMKPLQERTQRESEQEARQREVNEGLEASKKELTDFLGKNPDARNYLPIFQQVYSQPQFQHMTLGEVWARLQLNLLRRGQSNPGERRPQNQRPRNQRPPNGQGRPPAGNANSNLAPVDMSYEDIIRGLLPSR